MAGFVSFEERGEGPLAERRAVFVAAGAAASLLVLGGCAREDGEDGTDAQAGTSANLQLGFLMDVSRCLTCGACVQACVNASKELSGALPRRKLITYTFANGTQANVSVSCMRCQEPACLRVCPAGAITKRADGVVVVDKTRDIGCGYCYEACPFGVPQYTSAGMDKCDCCLEAGVRLDRSEAPLCVSACMTGALTFGPLEQLAKGAKGQVTRVQAPTKPSYLLVQSVVPC